MNPFKVGDRVRWINRYAWGPRLGQEFIVTFVNTNTIGFVSESECDKDDDLSMVNGYGNYKSFELIQTAEEIASNEDFNKRVNDLSK